MARYNGNMATISRISVSWVYQLIDVRSWVRTLLAVVVTGKMSRRAGEARARPEYLSRESRRA
ncbi:hypothetical protein J6590_093853 [Homalodisca vitripennis]|nr:hypothetical protein J6590_093853 [Homalodisca vitripennis]